MSYNILIQIPIIIVILVGLAFCAFVFVFLGKALFLGYIYEFKARKYIKKKYPKFKIDYLNQEVLENSVLCELHIPQGKRLFGSLKFKKGKIINELKLCDW